MSPNDTTATPLDIAVGSSTDIPLVLTKNDDLWFDDGNVVIAAENGVAFRLHRGVLSLHSDFFRDMFSLPHDERIDETMEGCPVVRSPDCAEHLAWFFALLYNAARDPFLDRDATCSFAKLRAMMKLGHKYGVDYIFAEASRRLLTICPTTLPEFDAFIHGPGKVMELEAGDGIAIVNLARTFTIPSLLPYAFYYCCTRVDPSTLAHGARYGPGQHEQLSPQELELCLKGMKRLGGLASKLMELLLSFAGSMFCGSERGSQGKPCSSKAGISAQTLLSVTTGSITQKLLAPLGLLAKNELVQLCPTCQNELQARHNRFRRSVWAALVEISGS